jgi:hypothetical protein
MRERAFVMIDPERLPLAEYRAYLRRVLGYDPMRQTGVPRRGRCGAIIDAELRAAGFPGLKRSDPDIGRSPSEMARLADEAARARLDALRERKADEARAHTAASNYAAEPTRPAPLPKDRRAIAAVGKRAARNSEDLAAFAAERGQITAEMVAERFGISIGAARVRLWRAELRGKLCDPSGKRKIFSLRREESGC